MSTIDGSWNITVSSPIGEQKSVLHVSSEGEQLSGTMTGEGGASDITDGKIVGGVASWSTFITSPMPLMLEFSGTIGNDVLSGEAKLGTFGNAPFTGTKT